MPNTGTSQTRCASWAPPCPPPHPLLSLWCLLRGPAQGSCVGRLKWENRTPQSLAQPSTSCLLVAHPCPTPLPSGAWVSSLALGSPKPVAPNFHLPLLRCSWCTRSFPVCPAERLLRASGQTAGSNDSDLDGGPESLWQEEPCKVQANWVTQ